MVARAQQQNLPVIGYLDWFGPSRNAPVVVELRAGLAEAGFIEGMNLSIEYRWANGNPGSYQAWPPTWSAVG